jgi:hypothetical protein
VRTCVSKSEIVEAACVPVWFARAYGSETIFAAVIVPSAISVATIVPSTKSADVIVPPRSNLVLAIAADALMSALTIVPLAIIVEVTVPVSAAVIAVPEIFVAAIAAEAFISALTIVPSRIIVLVTVPVSLVLTRVALVGIVVPLIDVAVATPRTGVTRVGLVANTTEPEPVSLVIAEARFADVGVARNVATPVPRPDTPVAIGRPVAFVRVPDAGVPSAGVVRVGLVSVLLVSVCVPVKVTRAAVSVIP